MCPAAACRRPASLNLALTQLAPLAAPCPQVDSADTPEQLSRLLDEVKDAGAKRVHLVFGCPGTTTPEERAAMLQASAGRACAWGGRGAGWRVWAPGWEGPEGRIRPGRDQ